MKRSIGRSHITFRAPPDGFEDSVNLAEECEEPARTFPRALFVGIALTGVIYLVVSFVAVALVDPKVFASTSGPLLEVVKAAGVSFPPWLFAVSALLAIGNTALINMMMASRLMYGMANENIVPKVFARVHRTRKIGAMLWGINRLVNGRRVTAIDPEKLVK